MNDHAASGLADICVNYTFKKLGTETAAVLIKQMFVWGLYCSYMQRSPDILTSEQQSGSVKCDHHFS